MTTIPTQIGLQPSNPYGNLFKTPSNILKQGNLVAFNYAYHKHDPYPVVIISKSILGNKINGINLHYLTFPYIKNILQRITPTFSYLNIKGDKYITNAYREYKWSGIRQLKELDVEFVLNVLGSLRALDINELEAIKQSIQQQVQEKMNQSAQDLVDNQQEQTTEI